MTGGGLLGGLLFGGLRLFEQTLARLTDRAATAPVLAVLEDLHWADTSTLDLVVFLAHNLSGQRVLLLATFRADEPASAERVRRLADGVRRSGSALALDLGPLQPNELIALLAARTEVPLPAALTEAIVVRSEGRGQVRARPRRAPGGVVAGDRGRLGTPGESAARRLLSLARGRGPRRRRRLPSRGERSPRARTCRRRADWREAATSRAGAARGTGPARARASPCRVVRRAAPPSGDPWPDLAKVEVLALLARGCTNREIAAELVISVRTAGVHVSHILSKLDAPNRIEAAAVAHRLFPRRARQPAFDD